MRGSPHDVVQFKGIFIKEDHFADGMKDDGSDIEVLKRSPKMKGTIQYYVHSNSKVCMHRAKFQLGFRNTKMVSHSYFLLLHFHKLKSGGN